MDLVPKENPYEKRRLREQDIQHFNEAQKRADEFMKQSQALGLNSAGMGPASTGSPAGVLPPTGSDMPTFRSTGGSTPGNQILFPRKTP